MKKRNIQALTEWIGTQPTLKKDPATPTDTAPFMNSKTRNYLKWKAKGL